MIALFAGTVCAFVVSLCLTPLGVWMARRWKLVDWPDGRRKLHASGVPLGGGCVVLLAVLAASTSLLALPAGWQGTLTRELPSLAGVFGSAVAICGLGLVDDRFNLRGRQKLLGQLAVVGLCMTCGLIVERITMLGRTVELGLLSQAFTAFWLLAVINAMNLLDGLDGLAAAIGMVLSVALAVMALHGGHHADAALAMILAGSLAGFLLYNAPPATIFLGDAGSMLIGLLLGALALRSTFTGPATVALAAPAALLAVPLFDLSMAVLRRKLTGQSVYTSDCGHLHHLLRHRGFSDRRIVLLASGLCGVCGVSAWAGLWYANDLLALVGGLGVLGTLVGARLFGYAELRLLAIRIRAWLASFTYVPSSSAAPSNASTSPLPGSHDWQRLWTMLVDHAEHFDLHAVHLHINWSAEHEVYDASWSKPRLDDTSAACSARIPLIVGVHVVGYLEIHGHHRDDLLSSFWLAELLEGLKPFETELIDQLESLPAARNAGLAPRNPQVDGETGGDVVLEASTP